MTVVECEIKNFVDNFFTLIYAGLTGVEITVVSGGGGEFFSPSSVSSRSVFARCWGFARCNNKKECVCVCVYELRLFQTFNICRVNYSVSFYLPVTS